MIWFVCFKKLNNFFIKYTGKSKFATLLTNKPKAQLFVELVTLQELIDSRY